jgi:hypothetical protein
LHLVDERIVSRQRHRSRFLPGGVGIFIMLAIAAGVTSVQNAPNQDKPATTKQEVERRDSGVRAQMRNVKYRFADNVAVQIQSLTGSLVPTAGHAFPVMDDKNSFKIHIDAADISIAPTDMANVLNSHVFARPGSPLRGISMSIEKGQLKVRGSLHDKGDIPFETVGTLSTTPEGMVRLHSEKVKALHVPVKGLMGAFGIEIDDLIKSGKVPGLQAEENDLILDLQQILPPPHIEGAATAIRVEENAIAITFGNSAARVSAKLPNGNFMIYRGNRMQFGKLTVDDCDVTLSDMDPADPMDFFLDHSAEQFAAGYTKTSRSFQLHVFLKDYDKLNRPKLSKAASS